MEKYYVILTMMGYYNGDNNSFSSSVSDAMRFDSKESAEKMKQEIKNIAIGRRAKVMRLFATAEREKKAFDAVLDYLKDKGTTSINCKLKNKNLHWIERLENSIFMYRTTTTESAYVTYDRDKINDLYPPYFSTIAKALKLKY